MLVQRVARGSLGENMGIRGGNITAVIEDQPFLLGGDIILSVENVPLQLGFLQEMRTKINAIKPGDPITITILRAGKTREITAIRK